MLFDGSESEFPDWDDDGVIPPKPTGSNPTEDIGTPYRTNLAIVARRLATTVCRCELLEDFLEYRQQLRGRHIFGWQWLGGSFTENCEEHRDVAPNDLDIMLILELPKKADGSWMTQLEYFASFPQAFEILTSPSEWARTAAQFNCHTLAPAVLPATNHRNFLRRVTYFFSLLSHQRETLIWKGILEFELNEHVEWDEAAGVLLKQRRIELEREQA